MSAHPFDGPEREFSAHPISIVMSYKQRALFLKGNAHIGKMQVQGIEECLLVMTVNGGF